MAYLTASLLLAASFSHDIEGRVFDHVGVPLEGALLWISAQPTHPEEPIWNLIAEASSSEGGRFRLTLPDEWIEASGVLRDLSVVVWKEGHGAFLAMWSPGDVPAGTAFEPWLGGPPSH